MKPFRINFGTDDTEAAISNVVQPTQPFPQGPDTANTGFCLDYQEKQEKNKPPKKTNQQTQNDIPIFTSGVYGEGFLTHFDSYFLYSGCGFHSFGVIAHKDI